MKESRMKPRFGSVYEINKQQWDEHVKNAPKDVPVIIHFYQDYVIECKILNEIFNELAIKHPHTKFVRAVATKCVENFADKHCPSLFYYENGDLVTQMIPCTDQVGGKRMTTKTVEYVLNLLKVIECHFDEDPRDKIKQMNTVVHQKSHAMNVRKRMDNECSSDEDDREYSTNQLARYR
mmetsp:Transcript_17615/g.24311  ORF Transcript_17615/g.24311 Transcript_17615/m.24311 type:complete len:179 (-) Transcript_17615:149-685(-)